MYQFKSIRSEIDRLEAYHIAEMEKALAANDIPMVGKTTKLPINVEMRQYTDTFPFHSGVSIYYMVGDFKCKTREQAIANLNKLFEESKELDQANKLIIEANEKAVKGLQMCFEKMGISLREYRTKQRGVKEGWYDATFWIELKSKIQLRYTNLDEHYRTKLAAINSYFDKQEVEERKKKAQEEQKAKEELEKAEVINLGVKYGLIYPFDKEDVIEAIIGEDKYLYLAYFLEKNRNDCNEGCFYAECGLRGFPPETEEDKNIHDEIWELCSDWCGDGRVFRDCEYNYGFLYSKAPQELYDDLKKLC